MILNRDLAGFAVSIAAIAEWLDEFWDEVHPRAADGNLDARVAVLGSLDLPTVVFPLQYAPLCEGRRIGAVTYRAWMIASGEVKPRAGEQKHPSGHAHRGDSGCTARMYWRQRASMWRCSRHRSAVSGTSS